MKQLKSKQIEIFCGTGGVGKTTLATSRALNLASKNKKILLVTVDPARRLKQILDIDDSKDLGIIKKIRTSKFTGRKSKNEHFFDALLLSPAITMTRVGELNKTTTDLANPILKVLTRPYGGLNEIMSIVEVQHQLSTGKYDTIILDTPPGKHFIDFLQASEKIKHFFDKSFVEIFKYLGKSIEHKAQEAISSKGIFSSLISSGVKKLLSYLEKVTGSKFVDQFITAVIAIYKSKESFMDALIFQEQLKDESVSNWFLVTSIEQQKLDEAGELQCLAVQFMHHDNFLAINKCLGSYLEKWELEDSDSDLLKSLKENMLHKEKKLSTFSMKNFSKILEFPEILEETPEKHVHELSKHWVQ
ncbi:MAG: AAA family ATPase [Bacteriovoracaceae bacterium]|nr:AAA family ATPase [Bacteriovoracaceae bacterium]